MQKPMNLDVHMGNVAASQQAIQVFLEKSYDNLPDRLHHFAPNLGALKSILGSKQMWASYAYDMNDKKELRYGSDLVRLCLEEKRKFYAPRKIFQLNEFFEMAMERANPYSNNFNGLLEPFVISLCEDGNSASQWEKYGNKGKGYCINFHANKPLLEEFSKKNLMLLKVIYDADTQLTLINTAIQKEIDHMLANLDDDFAMSMGMGASISLYQLLLIYAISFKSKSWSSEQEWRLVRGTFQFNTPVTPEERDKDGINVKFTKIDFSDFAAFCSVYDISAGPNADPEEAAQVPDLLATFRA